MIRIIFEEFARKYPDGEVKPRTHIGFEISHRERWVNGNMQNNVVVLSAYEVFIGFLRTEFFDLSSPDSLEKIDKYLVKYLLGIGQ